MSERSKKFWQVEPKDLILIVSFFAIAGILLYVSANAQALFGFSELRDSALNNFISSIFLFFIGARSFYRFLEAIRQKKVMWIDGILGVILLFGAIRYFLAATPNLFGGN